MTLQPAAPQTFKTLRALSNVAAFVAILVALDWGLSWWRGTPTYGCTVLQSAVGERTLEAIGLLGLITAMLGVMLGGARHWLTGLGVGALVFGLLGSILAAEHITVLCGVP
jgi:hypothetical protein